MWTLILHRLLITIPTLLIITLLVFLLQHALPGDPFLIIAGEERDPQAVARLRALYRMDDPIPIQYVAWLTQIAQGDFGRSLRTGEPVLGLIAQKLPVTIQLAVAAMLFASAIGVPAGVAAAVSRGTAVDHVLSAVSLALLAIPGFWLGMMMIMLFAVELRWLPASGYVPFFQDPLGALTTLAMPAVVLGAGIAAVLMRHVRSAMMDALKADYIRTARAKGVLEPLVVTNHALRNALVPVISVTTLMFGELLSGAVLVEQVFGVPGFGKLIVDGVFNRDYSVVQGVVLCSAVGLIAITLVADVLYIIVNPRLRRA
jgi:peptide/nickel transport system permease protein